MEALNVMHIGRVGCRLVWTKMMSCDFCYLPAHNTIGCLFHTATPSRLPSTLSPPPSNSPQPPRQFYRRPLPASCIAFATTEGRRLFKEALDSGFMEAYFDLAPQLRTQVQPSYCGLSALVMVLNSFEMDPGRVWKAPWRWYHEDMLTCCLSSKNLLTHGIVLDQFQSIAKCNGLNVELHQPTSASETVEVFRSTLANLAAQSLAASDTILVVCFDRRSLRQTGTGHYALIGGYHPQRDLVLLLETASFKYPPHWAPLTSLWTGMQAIDKETGQPRGYMLMTKAYHERLGLSDSIALPVALPPVVLKSTFEALPPAAGSLFRLANDNTIPEVLDTDHTDSQPVPSPLHKQLHLFRISDAANQAFMSPSSMLDKDSSGGRLRLLADDWFAHLVSTPLNFLGDNCCCISRRFNGHPVPGHPCASAAKCDCDCVVDHLLDYLLFLLVKHRVQGFFFHCQPISSLDASTTNTDHRKSTATASQVIFELVSSATGRRARLALERLPSSTFDWLTTDGPLKFDAVSYGRTSTKNVRIHPACALPLVADAKIRGTLLLTTFLYTFPYQQQQQQQLQPKLQIAPSETTNANLIDALHSSHWVLESLPGIRTQTCFSTLTPSTLTELSTLASILAHFVSAQRPKGTRCMQEE